MAKAKTFEAELFFRALADKTRLRLLNLIGDQEICVCYFVEVLKISQPKISRHLAYLRRAGIVSARREGKWMHYRMERLSGKMAAGVLAELQSWFLQDREMKEDRVRMQRACCVPEQFVSIQGAPAPMRVSGR